MLLIDFAIVMLLNLLFFAPIILIIALIKEGGPEGLLRAMGFIKKPSMAPPPAQNQTQDERMESERTQSSQGNCTGRVETRVG